MKIYDLETLVLRQQNDVGRRKMFLHRSMSPVLRTVLRAKAENRMKL